MPTTMSAHLIAELSRASHDTPPLDTTRWQAAVHRYNPKTGYGYWEIAMPDESVLEVNPVPAAQPGECWLWAVCHDEESGTYLTQGIATELLYQACLRKLHQPEGAMI